nr:unnamed protein product [Fasciola hepatica]
MRDGNIIPYDTDMDLFVLGSDEQKIRQLATARKNITVGQLNLVTRPGSYCPVFAVNPEPSVKGLHLAHYFVAVVFLETDLITIASNNI